MLLTIGKMGIINGVVAEIGATLKSTVHTAPGINSPLVYGDNFVFIALVIKKGTWEGAGDGDSINAGSGIGMFGICGVGHCIHAVVSPVHMIAVRISSCCWNGNSLTCCLHLPGRDEWGYHCDREYIFHCIAKVISSDNSDC